MSDVLTRVREALREVSEPGRPFARSVDRLILAARDLVAEHERVLARLAALVKWVDDCGLSSVYGRLEQGERDELAIITERSKYGTRAVIGYSPFGGYDISAPGGEDDDS